MAAEHAQVGRSRWRSDIAGAFFTGLLVVGFFLILLSRDPLLFWNDDYALSILPVFADVARSWSQGNWPLLSPYSWVCSNLAGEFQYGTFSIFVNAAVVLIWQLPLGFAQQAAALSITHLFVLAMGGYLLGRGRNFTPALAGMVGLLAALNGWIVCWGAIDWFGALAAFTWLPWAWWGMERALDPRRGRFRFLWPAPFVYLLIAGGFPYTVIMLALLAGWLALKVLAETRSMAALLPLVAGLALGSGLAAPAWLALFDYLHGSAREAQDSSAHWQWLVPPAALPGFFLPAWTVKWADFSTRMMPHTATELACGIVAPVAVLWGLLTERAALIRRQPWDLALLALVLIATMLPTASVFRWSFRWLPFLHLVLAVCAADVLQHARLNGERRKLGVAACGMIALTAAAMWSAGAEGRFGFPLAITLMAIAVVWALLDALPVPARAKDWMPATVTFASLLGTYLCIPPNGGVPKYNLDQKLTSTAPLDPQRLYISVHLPPEFAYRIENQPEPFGTTVRPGSTSMWGGVRFVNGYSPIRPAGVAREFLFGIHGEIPGWMSDYLLGWQAGAEGELARLGVDGVVVAVAVESSPRPEEEWSLVLSNAEGRVYHRNGEPIPVIRSLPWLERQLTDANAAPGAMLAHEERADAVEFAIAKISLVANERIAVIAEVDVPEGERPAMLAFSRPFFRGYRATIDGRNLAVTSYRGLMPMIQLPAGAKGRLVLSYRPRWLIAGTIVAAGSAAVSLAALALALRQPAKTRTG